MNTMVWKKNVISVFLWAAYFLGISAALLYYILFGAVRNSYSMTEALVMSVGCLLFVILLALFGKWIGKRRKRSVKKEVSYLLECILIGGILGTGIAFRIAGMPQEFEDSLYYQAAQGAGPVLTGESMSGISFLYVSLLRLVFLVFDAGFLAGIWTQMVLQILAAVILYFVIRRITGVYGGLAVLAGCMLLPSGWADCFTYLPGNLYLLLYALGIGMTVPAAGDKKRLSTFFTVLSGAYTGLLLFLDPLSITIIILFLSFLYSDRSQEDPEKKRQSLKTVIYFLMTVLIFGICILVNSLYHGQSFGESVSLWAGFYSVKGVNYLFWFAEEDLLSSVILLCFMVYGALGLCQKCRTQKYVPWLLVLLIIGLFGFLGISSNDMPCSFMAVMAATVVTGLGIGGIFVKEEEKPKKEKLSVTKRNQSYSEEVARLKEQITAEKERRAQQEKKPVSENKPEKDNSVKEIGLIKNPLPMPKAHVKKSIEYQLEPALDQMCFDVEVDDFDDFDIKE